MTGYGVIMLGGGLDSTALLLHLKKQGHRLVGMHFLYGQKAAQCEAEAVTYWCHKLDIPLKSFQLPLGEIAEAAILVNSNPESNKLEGRNVIFTMLAATYAATLGANDLFLGYHEEPMAAPFPDATMDAAAAMQTVLNAAYKHKLKVVIPFAHLTRTQILRHGYGFDKEILTKTHTCYENVQGGCGRCVHCKQRTTMISNLLTGNDQILEQNF